MSLVFPLFPRFYFQRRWLCYANFDFTPSRTRSTHGTSGHTVFNPCMVGCPWQRGLPCNGGAEDRGPEETAFCAFDYLEVDQCQFQWMSGT